MADPYLSVLVFGAVAVLVPAAAMLFSKLVRLKDNSNDVKTKVYESAEETVGGRVEIMQEYMHYFVAFLAFEIITVVVIIWSTLPLPAVRENGIMVIALLLFGFVLEIFLLEISRSRVV